MRIDGLGSPQLINIKGLSDILGKLNVGEKLEVQIIKIEGNELTLRLPNGQNVSATTVVPLDLTLGDFLNIAVKSKIDNQIIFQTIANTNEQFKFKDVGDTLMSLKLPTDERNIEIGRALANQHLPLNIENFKAIINVLGAFENIDIDKAVFIVANNIQSIPQGKELLDKFENNKANIGRSISTLIQLMASNLSENDLDTIFLNFEKAAVSKSIEDNTKYIQNMINNYTGTQEEDDKLAEMFVKQSIVQSSNAKDTTEDILNNKFSNNKLEHLLKKEDNKELFQFIAQKLSLEEKIINFLNDKSSIDKFIHVFSKENPAIFQRLSSSNSKDSIEKVKNFFKDIENNIKSGSIKNEINVNKLYNNLEMKLEVIENHLEQYNALGSEKIGHLVRDIKSEISFIKNIDNMFNFYQLPIGINQNNTTVDMYILKNSREHRVIDPDNATLFLSLNTQNLGQVEILMHVRDKVVSFNFRLEDDKTIDFFEKRHDILENILLSKGYTTGKTKFVLSTKATNMVNFGHIAREGKDSVKDVFDMRI